jgi:hypothetical protein
MSWLFSQALVEEYLGANCSDGELSAQLSGSHTQQAYCLPDKTMEFYRLSRFGMMFKPLMESLGQELLTSYRAGFPVKTYLPQAKAPELMESGQECGRKWRASFAKYDQDMCLWKTPQCSLIEDLVPFSEIWPQWGSMRSGECWERQTLGLNTIEKEYGLLPDNERFFHTPTTGSSGGSNSRKAMQKRGVTWPTPTTGTGGGERWGFRGEAHRQGKWDIRSIFNQPEPVRMVDGLAARVDRLKSVGNGQVPQVAAVAWELLNERLETKD